LCTLTALSDSFLITLLHAALSPTRQCRTTRTHRGSRYCGGANISANENPRAWPIDAAGATVDAFPLTDNSEMETFDFVDTPPLAANTFQRPDARWNNLLQDEA